jgi:MFS family permease
VVAASGRCRDERSVASGACVRVTPFAWLREGTPAARRALLAASLGWMLDAFDIFLYSLVLPAVMLALGLSKSRAGLLGAATLASAAVGGVVFGVLADRFGRTRALMTSVLLYALLTAACGLSWSFASLAVFRILLGFGMGGEWASGAALVSETWAPRLRSRALALMQSAFAIGYGLAALTAFALLPIVALLTIWIRRNVDEPEAWNLSRTVVAGGAPVAGVVIEKSSAFNLLTSRPLGGITLALTAMNACCMFAWWGFNLWVPAYLSLPIARGGIGFSARAMTAIVVLTQCGMWLGYVSFGSISDRFGRRRSYVVYLVAAAALLTTYASLRNPWLLAALGPVLAFAATGYWSGFAVVTADLYPTRIRATAQGLTYNTGRLASAAAPFAVGTIADRHGFGAAFHLSAAAFLLAALLWFFIPETGTAATRRLEASG